MMKATIAVRKRLLERNLRQLQTLPRRILSSTQIRMTKMTIMLMWTMRMMKMMTAS